MDAADRRRAQRTGWKTTVFRGANVLDRMEADAETEWLQLGPAERLALVWELSLAQYGGRDADDVEPRLPRSAYRIQSR